MLSRTCVAAAMLACAGALEGQAPTTIVVSRVMPKAAAIDATAAAFTANGFTVDRADAATVSAVPVRMGCCPVTYRATITSVGDTTRITLSATWEQLKIGNYQAAPKPLELKGEPGARMKAIADSLRTH